MTITKKAPPDGEGAFVFYYINSYYRRAAGAKPVITPALMT